MATSPGQSTTKNQLASGKGPTRKRREQIEKAKKNFDDLVERGKVRQSPESVHDKAWEIMTVHGPQYLTPKAEATTQLVAAMQTKDADSIGDPLKEFGPPLLENEKVRCAWGNLLTHIGGDEKARKCVEAIIRALRWKGKGRVKMVGEERQKIIADCLKWRPICEGVNGAFTELWELSEYESSELCRKEARGSLAEKYEISIENVEAIEKVLQQPSRQATKSTPYTAMIHMVALSHVSRDEKTLEKVWLEYLDAHPGDKRRKPRETK